MSSEHYTYFTRQLMQWHAGDNNRDLPWKGEQDPYKIWLSEIILQQTRAQQGLPYYLDFTEKYPTIHDMANAPDEEVYRIWQGLGYYNRCKNMLATARFIAGELGGRFPDSHEGILQLKGVGPYTAAAIASFAYGLPHAVVDGNVYRVLARNFGISAATDSKEGKTLFTELAAKLLDRENSAAYNQAIMDLGASICKPAKPLCGQCPVQEQCEAYNRELIDVLPVKSKRTAVSKRYFHYIWFVDGDRTWIRKRTGRDIWQNLFEPYLVETTKPLNKKQLAQQDIFGQAGIHADDIEPSGSLSQRLTHRIIESHYFTCHIQPGQNHLLTDGKWVPFEELKNFAFPRSIVSFLEKKSYF